MKGNVIRRFNVQEMDEYVRNTDRSSIRLMQSAGIMKTIVKTHNSLNSGWVQRGIHDENNITQNNITKSLVCSRKSAQVKK